MSPLRVIGDTIVQQVTINAPAERIFAALTSPAQLLKWWAAEGKFKATHVDVDLRPGGGWLMRVEGKGGEVSTVSGHYRKIEPPHVLEFTWTRDEENSPETLVCWELDEHDGVTTVQVTHSGLPTEALRVRNSGWPLIQSLLQSYVEQSA